MRLYKICRNQLILMKIVYMDTVQVLFYFVNFLLYLYLGIVNWIFYEIQSHFALSLINLPCHSNEKLLSVLRFVSWSWRKVLMGVCNVSLIIFDKISTNIFDRKWMWDTQRMSYIYFVSKIFFYDKLDLKFF